MQKDLKTPSDDDFESLWLDFVNENTEIADKEQPSDHEVQKDLPFHSEMDARVANAMMNANNNDDASQDGVAYVTLEMAPGKEKAMSGHGPLKVVFHPQPHVRFRQNRFHCLVYDHSFYPICTPPGECNVKRSRDRSLTMEMYIQHVWMPGAYILLVQDNSNASVTRIDFVIDDAMAVSVVKCGTCQYGGIEDVLVSCMQGQDQDWDVVARLPGMAQFRRRALDARQLLLYNELRKTKSMGEVKGCENLLICTRNEDIDMTFLIHFERLTLLCDHPVFVDCSSLFNVSCNNPFEPMADLLADPETGLLCLTNLKELTGSNGKVITRMLMNKVRQAKGAVRLWLCGSRQEIEELLGLYPSLRQFFYAESYIEQEPCTSFELVEAFLNEVDRANMQPDLAVKSLLSQSVLQGLRQGVLTNWSLADVRRFVDEEIRPRYLRRSMSMMLDDSESVMKQEDVPFEKLTSGSSAFDDSVRELNAMIGLERVKRGIVTMANQARLFTERRRRGLNTSNSMIFHAIFTGNPGTGKTTVARQLGRIYHALGLLSKGEVIAVDRTKLVGQFLGQTEENMKMILEEAKGNVLFIDEAYTLNVGSDDHKDFGNRVLESLLTILAQPNPDMLIIFAGYGKEMDAMLNTNPGLSGRFPYRYEFEDYTAAQLMAIALHLFERDDYILSDEAAAELQNAIDKVLGQHVPHFSNARWIEQFVNNGIIPAMADRLFSGGHPFSAEASDFQHVEASDVKKASEIFVSKTIALKSDRHRVKGFSA